MCVVPTHPRAWVCNLAWGAGTQSPEKVSLIGGGAVWGSFLVVWGNLGARSVFAIYMKEQTLKVWVQEKEQGCNNNTPHRGEWPLYNDNTPHRAVRPLPFGPNAVAHFFLQRFFTFLQNYKAFYGYLNAPIEPGFMSIPSHRTSPN